MNENEYQTKQSKILIKTFTNLLIYLENNPPNKTLENVSDFQVFKTLFLLIKKYYKDIFLPLGGTERFRANA